MKIQIYVINLARSLHRKQHIVKQLRDCNIAYSFVVAVDGLNKKVTDFKSYNQNTLNITGKQLKTTEIGAFLSHIKALKSAKKDGVDWAIIIEDDVVISPYFNSILNHIKRLDKTADCIRMYVRNAELANGDTTVSLRKSYTNWGGALGYAINVAGIDKVLSACDNFTMKIDNFLFGYWGHRLNIYQVDKNLVDIVENISSDIGYKRTDKPKSKPLIRIFYKFKYKILSLLN